MAVTPRDFLRVAEDLLNKPVPTEIEYRTAAARAYYAVMHLVRSELGLPESSQHGEIRKQLLSLHPARTPRFLAIAKAEWDALWSRRHQADYSTGADIRRDTANANVQTALRIFDLK
jgi:uncharacterized protein (UPF0332 family)